MITRKFVCSPSHSSLLDKELYSDITYIDEHALLTLKENIKVGYASSFQYGMDYIQEMASYFIVDTIREINMFNGRYVISGKGSNTHETMMDLTCNYFSYSFLDLNKVTIEMKGIPNPSLKLKGYFVGEFKNSIFNDGIFRIEIFSTIKGDLIEEGVKRENLLTSFIITNNQEQTLYSLSYTGVKKDTGEFFNQILMATDSKDTLKRFEDKRYKKLINKGLSFLN